MTIIALPTPQSRFLCSLNLWRAPSGKIECQVAEMLPELIEATGEEVPERMRTIAGWASLGVIDLLRQARALELTVHANDAG